MKTIDLGVQRVEMDRIFDFATTEPVLLLTADGREFVVSQADDFEAEVEALRNSESFQRFLDERMKSRVRIPLEVVENEIEEELGRA
ncbi:MAG TPA: hypothetical protein VGG06_06340 [Thermoanaerobaculia bacterium]|jgi:hypothetical protein